MRPLAIVALLFAAPLLPSHTAGPIGVEASRSADEEGRAAREDERSAMRSQRGFATYYASVFDGRRTASGTTFDNSAMLAAHPTLSFGTTVRVTNLDNQRSVVVTIVDRGPAAGPRSAGVLVDLSRAAAQALGFIRAGRARVRLSVIDDPAD